MGKYRVTYACGHPGEVSLFGKLAERERRIEWLEREGRCPACFRAEQDRQGPHFWVRPTQDGVEVVCYQGSYPVRAQLAALGLTFGDVWGPLDRDLLRPPRRGWSRCYHRQVPGDREALQAFEQLANEHGWRFRAGEQRLLRIGEALREGRPDLLPSPAHPDGQTTEAASPEGDRDAQDPE
ncbi:hypothetical protein [Deinococcus aluminii]|uniref:Uncharacterized protein n=1 Tax=Deinococcus aluminii TaxID=1656885 RepID=A0ABP9XEM8_9DEIO